MCGCIDKWGIGGGGKMLRTWVMCERRIIFHSLSFSLCVCACECDDMMMHHVIYTYNTPACHTYQWGMSHTWMCHVTHTRHVTLMMRYVTHVNAACHKHNEVYHIYAWGMSHIQTRHVKFMNEACDTYERVTSHTRSISHPWMRHITQCEWGMAYISQCEQGMSRT